MRRSLPWYYMLRPRSLRFTGWLRAARPQRQVPTQRARRREPPFKLVPPTRGGGGVGRLRGPRGATSPATAGPIQPARLRDPRRRPTPPPPRGTTKLEPALSGPRRRVLVERVRIAPIPHAPHGHDEGGILGIHLEHPPQASDVCIDRALPDRAVHRRAPDLIEQLGPSMDD